MENQTEPTVAIPLSESDVKNIIAFGNRSTMSGVEADTWVELKNRLAGEFRAGLPEPEVPQGLRAVPNDDPDAA